jgi:hypothetical protein
MRNKVPCIKDLSHAIKISPPAHLSIKEIVKRVGSYVNVYSSGDL